MKKFIIVLILAGCSSAPVKINSQLSHVLKKKTGVLLTVDLHTGNKIKRGKSCHLVLRSGENEFRLPLKEGHVHYGLNLPAGDYHLAKLDCGIFYFYKFKKEKTISYIPGKWEYWGAINFTLQDKKKLEWGNVTKSKNKLYGILEELNIIRDDIIINLLVAER